VLHSGFDIVPGPTTFAGHFGRTFTHTATPPAFAGTAHYVPPRGLTGLHCRYHAPTLPDSPIPVYLVATVTYALRTFTGFTYVYTRLHAPDVARTRFAAHILRYAFALRAVTFWDTHTVTTLRSWFTFYLHLIYLRFALRLPVVCTYRYVVALRTRGWLPALLLPTTPRGPVYLPMVTRICLLRSHGCCVRG